MRKFKIIFLFIFFILSRTAFVHAADGRDLIIQKEMDCVDQHLGQDGKITWNDVCDVPQSSYEEHQDAVSQQMDQIEADKTPDRPLASSQPAKKSDMLFEIAPEISYIKYREPTVMKQTGTMAGLNGTFTFHPAAGNYLNTEMTNVYRFEGRFSYGKVNVRGNIFDFQNQTVIPNSFNGISNYMVEIRTLVGKDYDFAHDSIRLTPFWGGGYRSLFDSSFANKPFGVNHRTQYLYIPAGAELTTQLMDGWSIAVDGEYDFLIRSYMRTAYEEVGIQQFNTTQTAGYGMRGSIKLIKKGKTFNLIFEPFIRYWDIHGTRAGDGGPFAPGSIDYGILTLKPDNNSMEIGGKLGIEF